MNLVEIGSDVVGYTGLAQDRNKWSVLVNEVMDLLVPYNAGKLLSVCKI
jgi:hypothetical protein